MIFIIIFSLFVLSCTAARPSCGLAGPQTTASDACLALRDGRPRCALVGLLPFALLVLHACSALQPSFVLSTLATPAYFS